MFEKSLYDLIRGLRSHRGSEREYIQAALKECRSEIRSADMDLKATALLKLIYLEMFGHDMTWASFNVLEVMSSPKIMQKRVGYLGAVQSFHADTDILMLATNLLKKDLNSPSIPTMSMVLSTLPHIVTSSLALSLLSDLLPRLSHSNPAVRKKTVVTLYRLALVYPETLRVAWPKIKDRLMDEEEDSSVTAATINVVCELGWRRPQDFLPLAPRLFDLLVDGGNNWMAIKIIKLFATLTPLEPRLVKKLLRPLTNIIQSTSAMSLLYECINGIIQGGILDATDGVREGEEVANLCITKLRGMIVVEGDPNLKYVALLAFNKIVLSHPGLVAMQEDVIMGCLDEPDISIKLQALELVSGMVSSENLQLIIDRLMRQLRNSPIQDEEKDELLPVATRIELTADSDGEDPAETLNTQKHSSKSLPPLPSEYRQEVVKRMLDMSSRDAYANITDFEWYIDKLVGLVKYVPAHVTKVSSATTVTPGVDEVDLSVRIGYQLRDIAVRVKGLRPEAARAAESLLLVHNRQSLFPAAGGLGVLEAAAWIAGEYAEYLADIRQTLDSLIHETTMSLPATTLAVYVQAIPKAFSRLANLASNSWDAHQQTTITLVLARTVNFLEQVSTHPSLEVQERAVEFLELLRLAKEALSSQDGISEEAPLLLTSAIPSLFSGAEINPVAPAAQRKVPIPPELDLDTPINSNLASILSMSAQEFGQETDADEFYSYYYLRPLPTAANGTSAVAPKVNDEHIEPRSYQSQPEDPEVAALRRSARRQRNLDDPFYIPHSSDTSGRSTPFHQILSNANGQEELDIDSIPIIDLQLNQTTSNIPTEPGPPEPGQKKKAKKRIPRQFEIAADETLDESSPSSTSAGNTPPLSTSPLPSATSAPRPQRALNKPSLLTVDSSTLTTFSLSDDRAVTDSTLAADIQRREREDAEMAAAIKEVERLRLQMQREQERVVISNDSGVDQEGTQVVRKKRRKKANPVLPDDEEAEEVATTSEKVGGEEPPVPVAEGPEAGEKTEGVKKKKKKIIIRRKKKQPQPAVADAGDEGAGEQAGAES